MEIGLDDLNGNTAMIIFKDEATLPIVLAIVDHEIMGVPVQLLTTDLMEVEVEPPICWNGQTEGTSRSRSPIAK